MEPRLKTTLLLFAFPAIFAQTLNATGFDGSGSGAVLNTTCLATVDLEIFGGSLSDTTDGMLYSGSFARVTLGAGSLLNFTPCSVTFTSTRTLNDVAGTYTLGSQIDGDVELLGAALNAALAALGLTVGPTTLTLNTFLAGNPADVASATLNLSTLALLGSVNASDTAPVHAFGSELLTQQLIFNFGSSGTPLLSLGAVLDILSSPQFESTIVLVEPDPPVVVPEPASAAMVGAALLAAVAARRLWRRGVSPV